MTRLKRVSCFYFSATCVLESEEVFFLSFLIKSDNCDWWTVAQCIELNWFLETNIKQIYTAQFQIFTGEFSARTHPCTSNGISLAVKKTRKQRQTLLLLFCVKSIEFFAAATSLLLCVFRESVEMWVSKFHCRGLWPDIVHSVGGCNSDQTSISWVETNITTAAWAIIKIKIKI